MGLRSAGFAAAVTAAWSALIGAAEPVRRIDEEIIVTARKVPEPVAEVPLVIDVIGDQGSASGVDSLQDLITRVPGLYFESAWGGMFSTPNLRGQQPSPTGDLNVGIFVDGIYQANPMAIDSSPVDVQRIEVVRGPQSALFGHSSFAGAIHYVSRAPTEQPESGFTVEAGSAAYESISGFLSGPIADGGLLVRLAVGTRRYDGTHPNTSPGGDRLGGADRHSLSLQIRTPERDGFSASIAARSSEAEFAQPPAASLTHHDYNCGAIEAQSGSWSYYCGAIPLADEFVSTAGLPDSEQRIRQLGVTLSWMAGPGRLTSRTSYYHGRVDALRDFDASSKGTTYGVCTLGISCPGPSSGTLFIDRLVDVNEVSRQIETVREWDQELSFSRGTAALEWNVGAVIWQSVTRRHGLFGADRGDLTADELLLALVPAALTVAGPRVLTNLALVGNSALEQVLRSLDEEQRRTLALFGTLDYELTARLKLRTELRATTERRALENARANFSPGFGTAVAPQRFSDLTPRISLQFLPTPRWSIHGSAAKGSQSGGINPIPGLSASEQSYDPEHNWTYEFGGRWQNAAGSLHLDGDLYYIDWRDTQLLGFPTTPGTASLITLNTAGLRTKGFEISLHAQPFAILSTDLTLASTRPEFRRGSDDPGSRRFCGLTGANTVSTLCSIGPSRSGRDALVPYIDGNVPARTPRRSWHGALVITPRTGIAGRLAIRFDVYDQDDVFERAINGARFGSRHLVDARVNYDFGAWSLAFWVRNLTDRLYVRALASRGQVFYPTTPRPLDAIYGEGRRFGLSASFDGFFGRRSGG